MRSVPRAAPRTSTAALTGSACPGLPAAMVCPTAGTARMSAAAHLPPAPRRSSAAPAAAASRGHGSAMGSWTAASPTTQTRQASGPGGTGCGQRAPRVVWGQFCVFPSLGLCPRRALTAVPAGCSPSCDAGEFQCAAGRCVPYPHRCNGHDDCGDFSDERGCVCPAGHFQCPDALCLPPAALCDGTRDCGDGTDEAFCPGEGLRPWRARD